jgi:hypothetical protein
LNFKNVVLEEFSRNKLAVCNLVTDEWLHFKIMEKILSHGTDTQPDIQWYSIPVAKTLKHLRSGGENGCCCRLPSQYL